MDHETIAWIGAAIAVLVYLDLLSVEIRRVVREGKRVAARLGAYADLPIFSLLAAAERDVERIDAALPKIAAGLLKVKAALTALRRGRGPA